MVVVVLIITMIAVMMVAAGVVVVAVVLSSFVLFPQHQQHRYNDELFFLRHRITRIVHPFHHGLVEEFR